MNLSTFFCSLNSKHLLGSNPSLFESSGTCPATFEGKSPISKPFIVDIPEEDFISLFQLPFTEAARGVTIPSPVTTTRLIRISNLYSMNFDLL
jgi:hypothetical protein